MHLAPLIRDLAILMGVAGVVTLLFQRIRQPLVLGYIVAGVIVGPHTPPHFLISDTPNIQIFAELGVVFLMFSLGLEFSFRKLKRVGGPAAFTAIFEALFMLGLGFATGQIAGWSSLDSIFLGAMLSISSTTIIIKALDELGLKTRRFAEMIFGILIVEDLVAILLLVSLSTLVTSGHFSSAELATSTGKLLLVVGSWFLTGTFVIPRVVRYAGRFKSDEVLTVLSVGLCLSLVVVAAYFHYSAALGAFIMGSILAESTESHRIENLMRPLRDVFAAIFFVSVGMLIDPTAIWEHKAAILFITLVTIVGKMISTTLGSLLSGKTLQTSVLVGFGLAQIGEFSFIIASLGLSLGVMSDFLYPVAVAVSLITTFTTPYLIRIAPAAAQGLEKRIPQPALQWLTRTIAWREQQRAKPSQNPELTPLIQKWMINAFVFTALTLSVREFGIPIIRAHLTSDPRWAFIVGWSIALLASAPFIWAMLITGKRAPSPAAYLGSLLLTLFWVAILSLSFFPVRYVGWVTLAASAFLFPQIYRQLDKSYHWFEREFLSSLNSPQKSKKPMDLYRELAPWDGHLVRIKVHADAEIAGKRLLDAELRKKYGLNIVAIQRGSRAIVAPRPDQQIFPKDELLVLGTDEQIDRVRATIEKPQAGSPLSDSIESYELRKLFIDESSPLRGKSIRQSEIREKYGAMVVGIERQGKRIMNPDSDGLIETQDTLWLVGESQRLP